jgi:hypothetical protein
VLVQPDKNELGDKRLNEVENLAKLREENKKLTDENRIPDQNLLEDKTAALGMPMLTSEFIRRLERLNPRLVIKPGGVRNAVQLRYPFKNKEGVEELEYVGGFYVDEKVLPEYSAVITDNRGLPLRELRGWRSVLVPLIERGIITLKQVEVTFGKARGQRSVLFNKHMQGRS